MGSNQNVERTDGERGPSYWDVSAYCEDLRARYGVGVRFALYPPHRAGAASRWTAWSVCVEVWRGSEAVQGVGQRVEYFGAGGAWKTAPAALHAALRALEERLERGEEAARAQHAF